MIRVAIVTNVIPSYRESFFQHLFASSDFDVRVYCQTEIPGLRLATVHNRFAERVHEIKHISAPREALVWQFLPVQELWKNYDVLVIYGNPRILSNVVLALLFQVLGKAVVLWGQAHSYSAHPLTERLRLVWWRLFKYLLVYTDQEAKWLQSQGFNSSYILGINNGLDQERIDAVQQKWSTQALEDWQRQNALTPGSIRMLTCARLESRHRLDKVLASMKTLLAEHPDLTWIVIGAGPEEQRLHELAEQAGMNRHIRWLGAVYEEELLAPWFLSATVLVQPGPIGLSLMHASGYGLPVITHNDARTHGPEFVVMEAGQTGLTFNPDDHNGLLYCLKEAFADLPRLRAMGKKAQEVVRMDYNAKTMYERFHAIVNAAYSASKPKIDNLR